MMLDAVSHMAPAAAHNYQSTVDRSQLFLCAKNACMPVINHSENDRIDAIALSA
jgi:hypothetical protein